MTEAEDRRDTSAEIRWPGRNFHLIQVRGRTYVAVAELLAHIREIETDSPPARQALDGLARQIESLV